MITETYFVQEPDYIEIKIGELEIVRVQVIEGRAVLEISIDEIYTMEQHAS